MIPLNIQKTMGDQTAPFTKRKAEEQIRVKKALHKLGLSENSQISQFLSQFSLSSLDLKSGADELMDLIRPYEVIYETTEWAQGFGLPEDYITLTSGEGEGFYLYNKDDKKVYDVELGQPWQDMIAGKLEARWNSFYEFLEWYLEIEE